MVTSANVCSHSRSPRRPSTAALPMTVRASSSSASSRAPITLRTLAGRLSASVPSVAASVRAISSRNKGLPLARSTRAARVAGSSEPATSAARRRIASSSRPSRAMPSRVKRPVAGDQRSNSFGMPVTIITTGRRPSRSMRCSSRARTASSANSRSESQITNEVVRESMPSRMRVLRMTSATTRSGASRDRCVSYPRTCMMPSVTRGASSSSARSPRVRSTISATAARASSDSADSSSAIADRIRPAIGHQMLVSPYGRHRPWRTTASWSKRARSAISPAIRDLPTPASPVMPSSRPRRVS